MQGGQMVVAQAATEVAPWQNQLTEFGVIGLVLVLLLVGKLRFDREVGRAEAEAKIWREAYEREHQLRLDADRRSEVSIKSAELAAEIGQTNNKLLEDIRRGPSK